MRTLGGFWSLGLLPGLGGRAWEPGVLSAPCPLPPISYSCWRGHKRGERRLPSQQPR